MATLVFVQTGFDGNNKAHYFAERFRGGSTKNVTVNGVTTGYAVSIVGGQSQITVTDPATIAQIAPPSLGGQGEQLQPPFADAILPDAGVKALGTSPAGLTCGWMSTTQFAAFSG